MAFSHVDDLFPEEWEAEFEEVDQNKIEDELELVRRHRSTQRVSRQRNLWPLASIVGYTNEANGQRLR